MERAKRISKGALKIVSLGTTYALSFLFIDNSTHIHCSSSGIPRFPGPTHHYHHFLLPSPPLFATNLSRCRSSWFQQNQEAVNWTSSSPPERAQWGMGSISYHCSMRGDCSKNWNSCLSMQVNPQALPSSDMPVPFMIPSLSAPLLKPRSSSTKDRFYTPLKDPGWQWGCSTKITKSMSQEGWKGLSACNSHRYRLNNVPSVRVTHCSLSSNTQS